MNSLNTDSSFVKLYDHWFGKTGDPNAAATMVLAQVQASAACQPAPDTSHDALSVSNVAQKLGVSKETVYKLCNEGSLRHTRIGRRITITPHQLSEYQLREDY